MLRLEGSFLKGTICLAVFQNFCKILCVLYDINTHEKKTINTYVHRALTVTLMFSCFSDEQFFCNTAYLEKFIKTSENAKRNLPGHGYFTMLSDFIKDHIDIGEMYAEYRKGACRKQGGLCDFCQKMEIRISSDSVRSGLRPYSNYNTEGFHYCSYKETLTEIDGVPRPIDDYHPRAQLKQLFKEGALSSDDNKAIYKFSRKFIVPEKLILSYIRHLENLKLERQKREDKRRETARREEEKRIEDYDWKVLLANGRLKKLTNKILDKYVEHYKLRKCKSKPEILKLLQDIFALILVSTISLNEGKRWSQRNHPTMLTTKLVIAHATVSVSQSTTVILAIKK